MNLISTTQLTKRFKCNRSSVLRAFKQQQIKPAMRIGSSDLWHPDDVEKIKIRPVAKRRPHERPHRTV